MRFAHDYSDIVVITTRKNMTFRVNVYTKDDKCQKSSGNMELSVLIVFSPPNSISNAETNSFRITEIVKCKWRVRRDSVVSNAFRGLSKSGYEQQLTY